MKIIFYTQIYLYKSNFVEGNRERHVLNLY